MKTSNYYNAGPAPAAIPYSVHSKQASQPHEGSQQYHGLGTMSLNYKVVDVSSTDPAFSAEAINTDHQFGANFGRGWISRKFCEFPQALTLRFENPVRIKTLQFLCHEIMISSRVELYYMPIDAVHIGEQSRIGHFEFQHNIGSEKVLTPVRELKTVHFGVTTKQLTVCMYGPYQHKDNIFHQVGLISVRAIGEVIGGNTQSSHDPQTQQQQSQSQKAPPGSERQRLQIAPLLTPIRDLFQKREAEQSKIAQSFPPHFRNLLSQIKQSHSEAVKGEEGEGSDPAQLEKLRQAEDVVTKQGNRVLQLSKLKQEAVDKEDYLTAKKIKGLIDQIESQIQGVDGNTGDLPDDINPRVLILRHQKLFEPPKPEHQTAQEVFDQNQSEADTSAQNLMASLNRLQSDRRFMADTHQNINQQQDDSMAQALGQQQLDPNLTRSEVAQHQEYTDQSLNLASQLAAGDDLTFREVQLDESRVDQGSLKPTGAQSKHNEDAVVPAHRRGVKMTFEEQMALYDNQIKQGLDPSPNMNLTEDIKDANILMGGSDYSGPLNNLFSADLVKLLTSLKWQDRFQGLKEVTDGIGQYIGHEKFSDTINHLLQLSFDEKNTQICLQTILLINIILTKVPDFVYENIDDAIGFICDKGVESKIQLASTTSYELLCRHKPSDLHDTIGILATQQSFLNKATLNSPKHILFRLTLLHRATLDFDAICGDRLSDGPLPEYPLIEVQEMLKHSLQHPEREIRALSQLILQLLYEKDGFTVVEAISKQLHPSILQAMKAKIPELDKVIQFLQKTKRVNSSSVYGSSGANGWPMMLKSRMNKAQAGPGLGGRMSSSRSLSYVKRRLPQVTKDAAASSTSITSAGENALQASDAHQAHSGSLSDGGSQPLGNTDLSNLLGAASNPATGGASETVSRTNGTLSTKDEEDDGTCQFCGIQSPEFLSADKMDLHYVLQCQMLTNCAGCTQIIEVSSYTEHKLSQCSKKVDFKQCMRCNMAIEADFYEQHIKELKCSPAHETASRCPLCQRDLPDEETEEKTWKKHLAIDKCPGANVRISTNAKARVSILRAKQPPAEEVIMEEEDEEDDNETVGAKTPNMKNATGGRDTEMSKKFEQEQETLSPPLLDSPEQAAQLRKSLKEETEDESQIDEQ